MYSTTFSESIPTPTATAALLQRNEFKLNWNDFSAMVSMETYSSSRWSTCCTSASSGNAA